MDGDWMVNSLVQKEDASWENEGEFDKFYCYYCLAKFDTYEEREVHQKKHDKNEPSLQMGW